MRKVALYILLIILSTIAFSLFSNSHCNGCNKTLQDICLGIYISVLAVLMIEIIKEVKMIFEYSPLEGKWEEYEFDKRNGRLLIVSDKKGDAEIHYEESNILTISLEHDKHKWFGKLVMSKDYIYTGEIVFHYEKEKDKENEHEFGAKKILIPNELNSSDKEFDYLYLIGINYSDKIEYGKTVLRRNK